MKSQFSLHDLRALLIQEPMAEEGTEELNFFVPELLPVAIKFTAALGTGDPKNFCHASLSPSPDHVGEKGLTAWGCLEGLMHRTGRFKRCSKMQLSLWRA